MGWQDRLKAAGEDAAAGAALGPFGAVAGGVYGATTGNDPKDAIGGAASDVGDWWKKRGPHGYKATGYDIDPTAFGPQAQSQYAGDQGSLIAMLTAQANGQGPSLADMELQQATDRNLSSAAALAGSGRGGVNPALAARNLGNAQASISQTAAGQAAMARVNEEMQARQALADAIATARGQDITQATANQNAEIAGQQLGVTNALGAQGITAASQTANNQLGAQFLGGALNAGGTLAAMLAKGGVVPGPDNGHDDKLIAARGGEVVVNPESNVYPAALADAIAKQGGGGAPLGQNVEQAAPVGAMPSTLLAASKAGMPIRQDDQIAQQYGMTPQRTGAPMAMGAAVAGGTSLAHKILQWMQSTGAEPMIAPRPGYMPQRVAENSGTGG